MREHTQLKTTHCLVRLLRNAGNLRFVAAPGAVAIKGQTEWFRLSVDDALDTVANVWKEKAGEDIMWNWDDSSGDCRHDKPSVVFN